MSKLSIIIPSREPSYLKKTVHDLLNKARGDIEVIISLDDYLPDIDLEIGLRTGMIYSKGGMRAAINLGVEMASGDYIMKLDEHCMVDEGFDEKLKADCDDNWVVIPRRYRLDADNWKIIEDGRPPIDYMYLENQNGYLHGTIDNERTRERKDILIDDTMTTQGSCYFMKKDFWYEVVGPMDDKNYGPFANEAQEICNKAWMAGGRVVVNKKTWYAHWHRDKRGYRFTNEQQKEFNEAVKRGREYSANLWLSSQKFLDLMEAKFGRRL